MNKNFLKFEITREEKRTGGCKFSNFVCGRKTIWASCEWGCKITSCFSFLGNFKRWNDGLSTRLRSREIRMYGDKKLSPKNECRRHTRGILTSKRGMWFMVCWSHPCQLQNAKIPIPWNKVLNFHPPKTEIRLSSKEKLNLVHRFIFQY